MDKNKITCMEATEYLRTLPDDSVDMCLTSPPYDNMRTYNGFEFDYKPIAHELYRVLKPGAVCVWVVKDQIINRSESLTRMRQALYFCDVVGFGLHQTIYWAKKGVAFPDKTRYFRNTESCYIFSKGRVKTIKLQTKNNLRSGEVSPTSQREADGSITKKGNKTVHEKSAYYDIWLLDAGFMKSTTYKKAYQHPAIMPEKLAERHILTWSNPGDLVMDIFMGSGTTAKMPRRWKRDYIGCDISQEYVDLANKRLSMPYTEDMFL